MPRKNARRNPATSPRSILIVRLSAIGDIVLASGVLPVLRREFPGARIDWLVQSEYSDLLQATKDLDRILVWDRENWNALLKKGHLFGLARKVTRHIRELRRTEYDLVLDLQGLWKSAIHARACKAKQRIGLDAAEGSGILLGRKTRSSPEGQRKALKYLRFARDMGFQAQKAALGLGLAEIDHRTAHSLLQDAGVHGGYAVLCPFSTRPQKQWPLENWAFLAEKIRSGLGLELVILGGAQDALTASELVTACPVPAVNLTGLASLRQSMALIQGARLAVGVDTGLTHIGIMSSVPAVALFGSTRPYLETGRRDSAVLYEDMGCSPCRRHPDCDGKHHCMRALDPERVYRTAKRLLALPHLPVSSQAANE
ncbi:MAG: glycosyltransferase family 9 protein [Desulfohalobiaceae bacterium]